MTTSSRLVEAALSYVGSPYMLGRKGDPRHGTDCSGFWWWCLRQVGVDFPVGPADGQIQLCTPVTVDEALATAGAMLWHPGHNAISLGDGRSVEARNPTLGVGINSAAFNSHRFTRGGLIPGITYDTDKGGSVVDLVWPVPSKHITSGYNLKRRLNFGKGMVPSPHAGIDMRAPVGTVVTSPVNGTVIRVVASRRPGQSASSGTVLASGRSGNGVLIRYGNRAVLLGHVAPSVRVGDTVKVGDPVGKVDLSGTITAAHLHAEDWADYRNPSSHTNFATRLATRASAAPTPPTPEKDWFDMATEEQLRKIVAEEVSKVWAAEFGTGDSRRSAGDILVGLPRTVAETTLNAQFGKGEQRRSVVTSLARIEGAVTTKES